MSLLDHCELLTSSLCLSSEVVPFTILLTHLNLHLACILLLVLELVLQVDPLLLKLLNLLPQVKFKHACVLDLHLLCLQLSHLVEQLVLFGCVLGLCFADSRH